MVWKVIKHKIKPKMESHKVKNNKKIKNKSINGWFNNTVNNAQKRTNDKYNTSKKKIPSIKESEKAIPNQLLKNKKKEK